MRANDWILAVALFAHGALSLACGGTERERSTEPTDAEAPTPEPGPEPARVPMFRYYENIFLRVTVEGLGPLLFLYDTGAPGIFLDEGEAERLGAKSGMFSMAVGPVDLGERKVLLSKTLVGGVELPGLPKERIRGYAGNALFEGHSVGLNFRDDELWIAKEAPRDTTPRAPSGTGTETVSVPFDPVGGYLSIPCRFSFGSADQRCLFDTGAMTSLTLERHWRSVPHPRPETLPQDAIDSEGNRLTAYFQRDEATMVGDLAVMGDAVKVVSEFELLDSVSRRLGLDLVGLVGVLTHRALFTTIDYPNERLVFRRFEDGSWDPPSPFVGYGFLLESVPLRVRYVPPEGEAARAGLRARDHLLALDGVPAMFARPELTLAQMIAGSPGERASFLFARGEDEIALTLTVEDLLPPP